MTKSRKVSVVEQSLDMASGAASARRHQQDDLIIVCMCIGCNGEGGRGLLLSGAPVLGQRGGLQGTGQGSQGHDAGGAPVCGQGRPYRRRDRESQAEAHLLVRREAPASPDEVQAL